MQPASTTGKRKISAKAGSDQLNYDVNHNPNVASIEKIRSCAYLRVHNLPYKPEVKAEILKGRLFHFILTNNMYFDIPQGVTGLDSNIQLPFNHIRVVEALIANGCKPTSDDLELTVRQKYFLAAFYIVESHSFMLTADQQASFDRLNAQKIEAHLAENQKLKVKREDLPDAMIHYLYFQKATIECLILFFKTVSNSRQFLEDCLKGLPNLHDLKKEKLLREKLERVAGSI